MKKFTLILAFLAGAALAAHAQNNEVTSATQSTNLIMSNAIDITFNSNGTNVGDAVNLAFEDINDYANGVESSPIELKVRSNKKFHVWAKAGSSRFSYNGTTSTDPRMSVNKLAIKVVNNSTGGTVPSAVNNKYSNMSTSNKKLINNGTAGGANTFAIQYKANPGYEFPAGTYTVNIIYTATQQ